MQPQTPPPDPDRPPLPSDEELRRRAEVLLRRISRHLGTPTSPSPRTPAPARTPADDTWALAPVAGAPRATYGAQCLRCGHQCWTDDRPRVEAWTLDHTHALPDHRRYLLTTQRHGRVVPTADGPHR